MRKLNLVDYQWTQKVRNPIKGQTEDFTLPYRVKDSILNILFLPALKLMGAALVKQNILAMKIEQAQDEVMLEEEEYERVKRAVEVYPAQSRADVELVDRILNQTLEQK